MSTMPRFISDSECVQSKCANSTTGCQDSCMLRNPPWGTVTLPAAPAPTAQAELPQLPWLSDAEIRGIVWRNGIRYSSLQSCDEMAAIALVRECEDKIRAALAAPKVATAAPGQWVRCAPNLILAGVDCGKTPRRVGDGTYSHDHFITHDSGWMVPDGARNTTFCLDDNGKQVLNNAPDPADGERFRAHLQAASDKVKDWPSWKRDMWPKDDARTVQPPPFPSPAIQEAVDRMTAALPLPQFDMTTYAPLHYDNKTGAVPKVVDRHTQMSNEYLWEMFGDNPPAPGTGWRVPSKSDSPAPAKGVKDDARFMVLFGRHLSASWACDSEASRKAFDDLAEYLDAARQVGAPDAGRDERDAARYRWLLTRELYRSAGFRWSMDRNPQEVDAAIDELITQEQAP